MRTKVHTQKNELMIKLACGVRGCWPIIVTTTTEGSTSTHLVETTESEEYLQVPMEQFNINENVMYLAIIATLAIAVIVLTIIIALYKHKQQKKKSEQAKLIKIIIATAQASAVKDSEMQ